MKKRKKSPKKALERKKEAKTMSEYEPLPILL